MIEDYLSIESFEYKYLKESNAKIFIVLNNDIINVRYINIMLNLKELRKYLKIKNSLIFTFKDKEIKSNSELDILTKDIINDNKMIFLKEKKININIIITNLKTIYKGKFLITESIFDLRKKFEIKNTYKFLAKDEELILLSQENEYKIEDILVNESDIYLTLDTSYEDSFSNKEIELIQEYYYLRINDKKTYKIKLNHDFILSEVRKKIDFKDIGNYFFLNLKGYTIKQIDEDKITIKSISFRKNNKICVNLIENEPIPSSIFIKIKNNLKIYKYPKITLNQQQRQKCKNLIVIGETGSGKTTLLNSLLNYLLNIDKSDYYRYIIIDENDFKNEGDSHTLNINSYYVLPSNKDLPPIKIIDTPGFGDTRENFDITVLDKLNYFFKNEDYINLICFVMKSTVNRNTEFQKYIMSNIVGLFGNDIIPHFVVLFTFCDGGEPLFLENLKSDENPFSKIINNISEPSYILFNNSSIFVGEEQYKSLFWDFTYKGFSELISKLVKTNKNELNLTREVIDLRNNILLACDNLNKSLDDLTEIQDKLFNYLKKFKAGFFEMENNKDYISIQKKEIFKKIETENGIHNINCIKCNKTCHKFCEEIKNGDISACNIMKNHFCKICGCSSKLHHDLPYYFSQEIQEKENLNIKKYIAFDKAQLKIAEIDNIFEMNLKKLKDHFKLANDYVNNIDNYFNTLNKISLFSNIYKEQENFVNFKINLEKSTKETGFIKKLDFYEKLKITFNRLNNIYIKNNIFKEIDEFDKDFNINRNKLLDKIKTILIDNT